MQVNKQLQKSILEIVDNQLRDNTPPQINITFKALKKMGYSDRDAKMAIGQALVKEMFEVMSNGREYSEKRYIADLKQIAQTGFLYTDDDIDPDDLPFDDDPDDWEDPDDWDDTDDDDGLFPDSDEPVDFLWQDLYRDYESEELHDFAVHFGLKTKKKSEEEIAMILAKKLLEPEMMADSFIQMNDELAEKIDTLMDDGVLGMEDELMDMLEASGVNPLYFHCGTGNKLIVCREVQQAYREINTPEFRAKRRQWSWMYQCLVTFCLNYGVGPASVFADLYNTHPQYSIDEEKVFSCLKAMGKETGKEYVRVNDLIVTRGLSKKKEWKKLQKVQGDTPFRQFTYDEIKDLGTFLYPYSHPDWAALRNFLNNCEEISIMTEEYMRTLTALVNSKLPPESYFNLLDSLLITLNNEETEKFAELCPKILKSTPIVERRGNCDPDAVIDRDAWNAAAVEYKNSNKATHLMAECDDLPF